MKFLLIFVVHSFFGQLSPPASETLTTDKHLEARLEQVIQARKSCGATSVWYCLRRAGRKVKLEEIWNAADFQKDGISLQHVLDLLRAHDVNAQAFKSENLDVDSIPVPSILVLKHRHCIVFEGFVDNGKKIRYFEPAEREMRTVSREELLRHWSGEMVVFGSLPLSRPAFALWTLVGAVGVVALFLAVRQAIRAKRPANVSADIA